MCGRTERNSHQFTLRRQFEYSKASANGQLFPFHCHRIIVLCSSTSSVRVQFPTRVPPPEVVALMNAVFPIWFTVPVVVAGKDALLV